MAVYQLVVEFIPDIWIQDEKNSIEALYDNDLYEPSIAWQAYKFNFDIEVLLSRILPKGKSWSENLKI